MKKRILVVSDAHGKGERIGEVLRDRGGIDYILYAGDTVSDLAQIQLTNDIKLFAVKGNCDFGVDYPEDQIIDIGKIKIFLTHGHRYRIKLGIDGLYYKAKEVGADIVVFGHTHYRYAGKEDGILFFNPGSILLPRDGKAPSYGIIDVEGSRVSCFHCDFF